MRGWAVSNSGPGDVLVDKDGCPVRRFKLPMGFTGEFDPNLQNGDVITANGKVRRTHLNQFSTDAARDLIKGFEGQLPYMYLDSAGVVTVGIGHALPTPNHAVLLPFREHRPTNDKMLEDEIANEAYIRNAYSVVKESGTQNTDAYSDEVRQLTRLRLSEDQIVVKFMDDITAIINHVSSAEGFPRFETLPPAVRYAIIDMGFNLGPKAFPSSYPDFRAAINIRNWREAATESKRQVTDPDTGKLYEPKGIARRNEAIRGLFEKTAISEPFFHNPTSNKVRRLDEWNVQGFL